jgi:four helix bundle protein
MPTHYEDLLVWQKGMEIAKTTYILTKAFPEEERFGLVSQMRRAAISIPSNIAEGHGRQSKKEFKHFLKISKGSAAELDTQLRLCLSVSLIKQEEYKRLAVLIDETSRMLYSLIQKLSEN